MPEEQGVVPEKWQQLVAWKSSAALSTENTVYRVCRFLEAWLAVKRMRGDEGWKQCLDGDEGDEGRQRRKGR